MKDLQEKLNEIDAEIKEVVDGELFDKGVNHENALFSLAVDMVAGYYVENELVVCRKIKRQGKIIH